MNGNVETRRQTGAHLWRKLLLAGLALGMGLAQAAEASSRRTLVFGGDASFPPFEWLDQGMATGLNVDLVNQLARQGDYRVDFRLGMWPDTLAALKRGDVDVIAAAPTVENSKDLLFTAPFYYVEHAVYTRNGGHPIDELDDLSGQRVAVPFRCPIAEQLERERIRVRAVFADDVVRALQALVQGDAEYAILPAASADRLIHHGRMPVTKVLPSIGTRLPYALAVHRSKPELFEFLQESLAEAAHRQQLQAIQQRWESELEFSPLLFEPLQLHTFLVAALGLLSLAALWALFWSYRLRRQVGLQTEELAQVDGARFDADYDSSTNLPKEHEFIRQVDDVLSKSSRSNAQELRLIKLTALNETIRTLGREYAEQLLRRFADSIRGLTQDRPCGYLGRGVYAMFHEAKTMPRIFDSLLNHWSSQDAGVYAQIVGGSAYWPTHGGSGTELIHRAETALSASHASGMRWLAYSPDMEPKEDDLEIVSLFRDSELEGLTAVYQPQVSLRRGAVVAAEALVRWNHPTLGNISPARFIPLIEKAGLVPDVTTHMLNQAAEMSVALAAEGLPSTISINITVSDLMQSDMPGKVEEVLKRVGVEPASLKLELTESSVASDLQSAKDVLHALHDLGVLLSIDDFGTGYSSLSYLSAFPIHEVKIDRHFVSDMTRNPRNRSIVRSTILMASELGLQTVAEGAEDKATLELLTEYKCDRVQGYVFAQPLSEADYREFARKYQNGGLM